MQIASNFKQLWSCLNGVVCVHKPRNVSIKRMYNWINAAVCKGINECFPQANLPLVDVPIVEPHPKSQALLTVGQRKQVDYSLHPLVIGDTAVEEDIRIEALSYFETSSSGVCCKHLTIAFICIECLERKYEAEEITGRVWLNEYKVMGHLGRETVNNKIRGKVTRTCDYTMVTRHKMKKLLNKLEMRYRNIALELADVEPSSQEAFELQRKGFPRPKNLGLPVVFRAELTLFKPPIFLLTLQCVSETDAFIRQLVREIGIDLGSTASCRRILRTHLGPFSSNHSLLDKHFNLQTILTNMTLCRRILDKNAVELDPDVICWRPEKPVNLIMDEELVELLDEGSENNEVEVEDCLQIPWGRNYEV